jgi:hypothetical protein
MFEKVKGAVRGVLEARDWHRQHEAPAVGEPAPDFELRDVHGGEPVRLSSFAGTRPVALVFGSFT